MPAADDPAPSAKTRRRRSDAALNHATILDSARLLLADDGDASVAAIADHAGLGRGTVHRHFATREDLITAVRRQARDDAESDEEDHLRPPGELAAIAPAPLSVADVLNKVAPFQLGEQIIAEAQRIPGVSSAALYVVDLDGSTMQRLAGPATFPDRVTIPLAVGPEIPREGVAALRAVFAELLPAAVVAPLHLRGRAIGVLLAVGSVDDAVHDLAREAAVALALAPRYTDYVDTMRRTRPTSPAAEIQQNLLPPRIARIAGGGLAGNVLPGYEIGGDWFDYAENHEGAWIGIADSAGTGPRAAGIGAVSLGAFRATRRGTTDPAAVLRAMHDVLLELGDERATATATVGCWNAPASTFHWVCSGEQSPIRVGADGRLEVLADGALPERGSGAFPDDAIEVHACRLVPGERLLLLSDGILDRRGADDEAFGLRGVEAAAGKAADQSAPATLRAIEDAVRELSPEALEDDATLVVLAAGAMAGRRE
jgi:serine phosphatase RsbU (regulator of sigma subunit)